MLLVGETGVGKTSTVSYMTRLTGVVIVISKASCIYMLVISDSKLISFEVLKLQKCVIMQYTCSNMCICVLLCVARKYALNVKCVFVMNLCVALVTFYARGMF